MKLHKRTLIVQKAGFELDAFFMELQQKHELTYGEMFKILGERMCSLSKYAIRQERHPDDENKRGDEA